MIIRRATKPAFPNPQTYIVQASDLCSMEVYQYADGNHEPVLKNINLQIRRSECWGILGEEPFELELLAEIIGCVRPYGSGRVVLVERGMMRKKRRILPHVFYISNGDTVFPNMNTLEYLMFATAHQPSNAKQRQAAILRLLLDTGLYYLTLVPVKYLTQAQKAVICLIAASFSNALLVIFAIGQLNFDELLCVGMHGVVQAIIKRGGAILISTQDSDMVQAACTHAAFLNHGTICHSGTMEEMLSRFDKRVFTLESNRPKQLSDALAKVCPELTLQVHSSGIYVYDYRQEPITQQGMLQALLKTGETVESISSCQKKLRNAYREVLEGNDL